MTAPLTLILKTTVPTEKLTLERLGVGDSKIDRFDIGGDVEHAKKLEKTSKS